MVPDFRVWELFRTMPLVSGFSRGSPVYTALAFRRCSVLISLHPHRLSKPRDLDAKSRSNLFTHSPNIKKNTNHPYAGGIQNMDIETKPYAGGIQNMDIETKPYAGRIQNMDIETKSKHWDLFFPMNCSSSVIGACGEETIGVRGGSEAAAVVGVGAVVLEISGGKLRTDTLSNEGATVAERLACSPPTKAIRVQSPVGSFTWESCRTMPLVGGSSRGCPVSPALSFRRCSIFTSITLIGSQDLDDHDGSTARLARRSDEALGVRVSVARIAPSLLDQGRAAELGPNLLVRQLATHQGQPASISSGVAPGFSHVGIVLDDAACQRVFTGYSRFPRLCIPAPLYPRVSFHVVSSDDGHLRVAAGKPDKIDVKLVYTEVDFVTGSQFIRHALDDSEPIADLQGNK
ncbi:hypothetical protein PR048_027196 [Dryococelus australis]|uniref:Uncharacterized protein n=1 Tax=Dryococelus australis TaxID=614101 RepID=A0ABQ9GER2_9NEOP|nr:hypothetical protein PR048_027196 [Dryococelus australis]